MRVAVIISTYKAPVWLEKVLWGYHVQDYRDFEIVVADDGSTPATAQMLERMRAETRLKIKHIWQADQGFRKCRILNKAIVAAKAPYLVFTDGDCIPRRDFLAVHAAAATPGHYLAGSYNKLPLTTSQAIGKEDILSQRCFDLSWLKAHGLVWHRKHRRLTRTPQAASWLNRVTLTRANFKGANSSVWRSDAIRVNGFDERMLWGGLDREFGVRLVNAGVQTRHVRHSAIVVHLDHQRRYVDPERVRWNRALRQSVARDGIVETPHGIKQLPSTADAFLYAPDAAPTA